MFNKNHTNGVVADFTEVFNIFSAIKVVSVVALGVVLVGLVVVVSVVNLGVVSAVFSPSCKLSQQLIS